MNLAELKGLVIARFSDEVGEATELLARVIDPRAVPGHPCGVAQPVACQAQDGTHLVSWEGFRLTAEEAQGVGMSLYLAGKAAEREDRRDEKVRVLSSRANT